MTRIEYLNEVKSHLPVNPVCVEIGVLRGEFSRQILDVINPSKLFLIDLFAIGTETYGEGHEYLPLAYSTGEDLVHIQSKLSKEILNGQAIIRKGLSYERANDFVDKYFDFIYIDACHLYECVKQDLELYLPRLKDGGLMAGHDYSNNQFGIKKAVDEFISAYGFEMILLSSEGDFALKRK